MAQAKTTDRLEDRQFELAIRKLADALAYGGDPSSYLGSGIDYAQSRTYVPGDPIRSIDWRLTARSGRVYVKEYEKPKQTPTWIVLDDSASMAPASGPTHRNPGKWAWALRVGAALGLAAIRQMRPVGWLTTQCTHTPSMSRGRLLDQVHRFRRRGPFALQSLGEALRARAASMVDRSQLIVLSDWHDPSLLEVVRTAAERHDLLALRLFDPIETQPIDGRVIGVVRGQEAESGRGFVATAKSRFAAGEGVAEALAQSGVDCFESRTDRDFVPLLREFVRRRGAGQREGVA